MKEYPILIFLGYEWQLLDDLIIQFNDKIFIVPKGQYTDFASIPRFLWCLFPPFNIQYLRASILHDFLYRNGIGTRKEADKIFLELMIYDGTPKWKAYLFYYAVRLFGIFAWNKLRNKEV